MIARESSRNPCSADEIVDCGCAQQSNHGPRSRRSSVRAQNLPQLERSENTEERRGFCHGQGVAPALFAGKGEQQTEGERSGEQKKVGPWQPAKLAQGESEACDQKKQEHGRDLQKISHPAERRDARLNAG